MRQTLRAAGMPRVLRAARRAAGVALLGAGLTGCYRYVAVSRVEPVPLGARVRVQLDDRGTDAIQPSIGPSVIALEGEAMEWRSDSVVLSVRSAQTRSGERFAWTGLRAAFPPAVIERIERRALSRSRSAMLAAGAVAAAALVIKLAIDAAAGGTPGGGGPPPPMP